MDFDWSPRSRAVEQEVVEFLDANLPPELDDDIYRSGESHHAGFARALADRDWVAPGWDAAGPAADLGPFDLHLLDYELTKAESPTYLLATSTMVARVIELVGSDELKAEIVPAAMRGEVTIALGMSEPEAGSDVAAVQTRARRDGDEWVIDGQKMFTTNGHLADYVFLLARSNPEVPNHKGLTIFLVPLDHPGVEAQAVYTLSGERTNITFYSDVRLADRWRIGEVDDGWGVARCWRSRTSTPTPSAPTSPD